MLSLRHAGRRAGPVPDCPVFPGCRVLPGSTGAPGSQLLSWLAVPRPARPDWVGGNVRTRALMNAW
jgi:hypothetical protein